MLVLFTTQDDDDEMKNEPGLVTNRQTESLGRTNHHESALRYLSCGLRENRGFGVLNLLHAVSEKRDKSQISYERKKKFWNVMTKGKREIMKS